MIGCIVLCAALGAGAQNAHRQAAPIQAAPMQPQPGVAMPVTALQKQRDELQSAIVKDDLVAIRAFIRSGQKLDFNFDDEAPRQRSFESPLTMAVFRNKPQVVRVLLDAGASATRADGSGRPPIQLVKSLEVARMLVAAGADPNAQNYRGYTPLAEAAWNGDVAAIDSLVAVGARFDAPSKSADVFTIAAEMRKPQVIPMLLERGADPRRPPTKALPALIDAGQTEAAVALLRAGADPNAQNQYAPVLLVALFRKRWEIADALLDAGATLNLADPPNCASGYGCWSIQAARYASFEPPMLKKLAARGLDLDVVSAKGQTALTSLIVEEAYAVRAVNPSGKVSEIPAPDNVARVRNLLAAGADANRKAGDQTPLMVAISHRRDAFADVVFEAGGRVDFAQTIPADTPQGIAIPAQGGRLDVPPTMLNYRGVNTGMSIGPLTWTALLGQRPDLAIRMLERDRKIAPADQHLLYFAGFLGQWDLVLAALPYKPDVNAADRANVTPLMLAAQDGRADVVRGLLAAGAKVNTRSAKIWPPLFERNLKEELGAFGGHSPSAPRLVGDYTATRAAKERGHAEVVRILTEAGGRE